MKCSVIVSVYVYGGMWGAVVFYGRRRQAIVNIGAIMAYIGTKT